MRISCHPWANRSSCSFVWKKTGLIRDAVWVCAGSWGWERDLRPWEKAVKACSRTAGVSFSSDRSLSPCSKNSLVTSSATLGHKHQPLIFHRFSKVWCNILMLNLGLKARQCIHCEIICADGTLLKQKSLFELNSCLILFSSKDPHVNNMGERLKPVWKSSKDEWRHPGRRPSSAWTCWRQQASSQLLHFTLQWKIFWHARKVLLLQRPENFSVSFICPAEFSRQNTLKELGPAPYNAKRRQGCRGCYEAKEHAPRFSPYKHFNTTIDLWRIILQIECMTLSDNVHWSILSLLFELSYFSSQSIKKTTYSKCKVRSVERIACFNSCIMLLYSLEQRFAKILWPCVEIKDNSVQWAHTQKQPGMSNSD